jgi:hypothetical protein
MSKQFLSELGARIRAAREAKGLSQEDVANEAGLERAYYGRGQRGEANILATKLFRKAEPVDDNQQDLMTEIVYRVPGSSSSVIYSRPPKTGGVPHFCAATTGRNTSDYCTTIRYRNRESNMVIQSSKGCMPEEPNDLIGHVRFCEGSL